MIASPWTDLNRIAQALSLDPHAHSSEGDYEWGWEIGNAGGHPPDRDREPVKFLGWLDCQVTEPGNGPIRPADRVDGNGG